MQNIPDKGVSSFHHYLRADATVTGLTGSARESQVKKREKVRLIEGHSRFGKSLPTIAKSLRIRPTIHPAFPLLQELQTGTLW